MRIRHIFFFLTGVQIALINAKLRDYSEWPWDWTLSPILLCGSTTAGYALGLIIGTAWCAARTKWWQS